MKSFTHEEVKSGRFCPGRSLTKAGCPTDLASWQTRRSARPFGSRTAAISAILLKQVMALKYFLERFPGFSNALCFSRKASQCSQARCIFSDPCKDTGRTTFIPSVFAQADQAMVYRSSCTCKKESKMHLGIQSRVRLLKAFDTCGSLNGFSEVCALSSRYRFNQFVALSVSLTSFFLRFSPRR